MREQFADLVTDLKALKNASPWAAAQLGKKAMIKAAQCMEASIDRIEQLEKRIQELEGGGK